MLLIENLRITYSGALAVNNVSLQIDHNDSVALLGPNGAGKTSIARAIAGLIRFDGDIRVEQGAARMNLNRVSAPTWSLARSGIVYISETNAVFESLSVRENLIVVFAAHSVPSSLARDLLAGIYDQFPFLHERAEQRAGCLSGGQKKLLAIARGLLQLRTLSASSQQPLFKLLIVDEPSRGLSPQALEGVREALSDLGGSLLLIEQMARFALDACKRGYVMRNGKIVLHGSSEALNGYALERSYLGPSLEPL